MQNRIDSAFQNLPENPAELAVPLSRRALAKRASVLSYVPEESPAALEQFGRLENSAGPSNDPEQTAGAAGDVDEGSADAPEEPETSFRTPRPRPDPMAEAGGPIDLVAAPAPADELSGTAQEASAPAEEKNEPDLVASAAPETPDSADLEAEPAADAARLAPKSESPAHDVPRVTEVPRMPGEESPMPEPDPATLAALQSAEPAGGAWVPPPRPAREGDAAAVPVAMGGADLEVAEPAVVAEAAKPSGPCRSPEKMADKDEDFGRNAEALSADGFCITEEKFKERKRPWTVQTVTSGRPGPLWAVLHDDEDVSFDTAVHALQNYGGVLVTVDTGGKRNQDGIDPNRNFSDEEISCAKLGKSAAPKFTEIFKKLIDPSQPIVALHNNFHGPVPTKGLGHVSMTTVPKDMRKVASKDPDGPLAGEHALVLLAASEPVDESAKMRMQALAGRGLNVVLEPVRDGKGDCSLSNYAVLSGHEDYFNVTVHHDEGEKQRKMIEAIMTGFPTVSASR